MSVNQAGAPQVVCLRARHYEPVSKSDYAKVTAAIGLLASALYQAKQGDVRPLKGFCVASSFCLGYASVHGAGLGVKVLFSKIILRRVLGQRLQHSLTPGPNRDYYNHHRKEALSKMPLGARSVRFPFSDKTPGGLDAIWINRGSRKSVLMLPGAAGSAGVSWPVAKRFYQYECNIFSITMRGYRGDDGIGSDGERVGMSGEITLINDAVTALHALQNLVPDGEVIVYGYSTGGYFAACLGYYEGVKKVILRSAFTSFVDVASEATGGSISPRMLEYAYPTEPEKNERFFATGCNTLALVKAARQTTRFLILHGMQDRLVSVELGVKLAEASNQGKNLVVFKGGHAIEDMFDQTTLVNYPNPEESAKICYKPLRFQPAVESSLSSFVGVKRPY